MVRKRRGDDRAVARELNSIGNLHGRTGRFADALLAHNEALRLSRGANDRAEAARSLRMLGILYRNLDDEELEADDAEDTDDATVTVLNVVHARRQWLLTRNQISPV